MDRPFAPQNERERKRLQTLVARLSDRELQNPMDDGWTVAVTLAHLAFWDQRSLLLLRRWKKTGKVELSPIDIDLTNEALLPLWRALPGRTAAELALAAAEAIDRELESYPLTLIPAIEAAGDRYRLYRAEHRQWHLDQIAKALAMSAG
jgi:hypothetical protein